MHRTSGDQALEQDSLGQPNWVLVSAQTRKFCSVYRAQSDEANKSPLTSDDQWSQPESKNGSRIYQCHKKMTQRTRLAKSEPIQKQRTVTVVCVPTFTPISILLTDSKRALKAGKIARHVKGSRQAWWPEFYLKELHPRRKSEPLPTPTNKKHNKMFFKALMILTSCDNIHLKHSFLYFT